MAVRVKRERTVSFRLSEEEHKRFQELLVQSGARSMSDFVRNLLLGEKPKGDLTEAIRELTTSVNRLSGLMDEMSKALND